MPVSYTHLDVYKRQATDRNRTSPFAFTGNKFEFRMVGSQDSVAQANIVLNTIVAEAFSDACDILEKADNFDLAVHDLIKDYAVEHQRIVFNGNGYSDEWVAEAERRGLPNIKSMVDAIPAYVAPESVAAFEMCIRDRSIGCTGGKHRSVTLANELYKRLSGCNDYGLKIEHRDIGKDALRGK